MTKLTEAALQWLASRGEMRRGVSNDFIDDTMGRRTAWALERRGLAERRYTGASEKCIYITSKGQAKADELLDLDPEERGI